MSSLVESIIQSTYKQNEEDNVELIFDKDMLTQKCKNASLSDAIEIWKKLEFKLSTLDGYGLAANQIGVPKRIGFIDYEGLIIKLLNSKIVEYGKNTILIKNECCFSFPKKSCNTVRYSYVKIEDELLGTFEASMDNDGLLPIILQHEIDHFNGKTIFDNVQLPYVREVKKQCRNSLCKCGSGKKFKFCCLN